MSEIYTCGTGSNGVLPDGTGSGRQIIFSSGAHRVAACVLYKENTGMVKPVYYGIVIQMGKDKKLLKSLITVSCICA